MTIRVSNIKTPGGYVGKTHYGSRGWDVLGKPVCNHCHHDNRKAQFSEGGTKPTKPKGAASINSTKRGTNERTKEQRRVADLSYKIANE